ncbi:MAG: TIGR02266 family protein [Proteobacteria bacterium]|nr:TIGR02266 family protein [Pseudomonadota bacterium]
MAKGFDPDKRLKKRISIQLDVRYQSLEGFISDYSMNISQGGMFISTRNPLPLGTRVALKVGLPDAELPLNIEGEVVWVSEYDKKSKSNLIPGMGVQFRNLDEQEKKRVEDFIAREAHQKGITF